MFHKHNWVKTKTAAYYRMLSGTDFLWECPECGKGMAWIGGEQYLYSKDRVKYDFEVNVEDYKDVKN